MKKLLILLAVVAAFGLAGCGIEWFPDGSSSSGSDGGVPTVAPAGYSLPDQQADTDVEFPTYTVGTLSGGSSTSVSITGTNDTGSGNPHTSEYTIVFSNTSTAGPFNVSSGAQKVATGDKITIRHTTANGQNSTAITRLTVGGLSGDYKSTTSSFSFPTDFPGASSTKDSLPVTVPTTLPNSLTFPVTLTLDTSTNTNATNNKIWKTSTTTIVSTDTDPQPVTLSAGDVVGITHTTGATSGPYTTTVILTGANSATYTVTYKSKVQ